MTSACIYCVCPFTNRILAVSRKDDLSDFGLPGGKSEKYDRDLRATAAREFLEETGAMVDPRDLIEIFRHDGCATFEVSLFKLYGVTKRGPQETGRVAWVTPQKLCEGSYGDYNRRLMRVVGRLHEVR